LRNPSLRRAGNLEPFAALLATLVATLFVPPFVEGTVFGVARFRLVMVAILLAGVYAVSRRRQTFWIGTVIAFAALAIEGSLHARPTPALSVANFALSILFFGFLASVILYTILAETRVTLDTILGGICVYLLLGVLWSIAYSFLEYLEPGSFWISGAPLPLASADDEFRLEELIYFSFVTLTTLGYGDILAKTNPARALAAAEAVTGSLYVAVFIARLVGLHMVHQTRELDL
jgi:voltage-gated potassium channel